MAIDVRLSGGTVFKFALLAFQLVLSSGCSTRPQADYAPLGLVEIAGVIALDGQPVPQAAIFFYHPDGSYSYGITDASGHYVAMFNSEKSGVLPGFKQIEISTVHSPIPGGLSRAEAATEGGDEANAAEEDPDRPGKRPRRQEQIPACYNAQGILKVNINRSDRSLDFDLKSDCSTTTAS